MKPKPVFRLAATLFAESNYLVRQSTILKKVVECAFVHRNNSEATFGEIVQFIETNFGLQISIDELANVVKSNRDCFYEQQHIRVELTKLSLSKARFIALQKHQSNPTLDYYIEEFLKNPNYQSGHDEHRAAIYRYFHNLVDTNIEHFRDLLNISSSDKTHHKLTDHVDESEREIVNAFLAWDNPDKNKAIFDLVSYSLEYCLLSGKKELGEKHLQSLYNKTFYLDANILFRAIGVNGHFRKHVTIQLLKKCKATSAKLLISQRTDNEFRTTIQHYAKQIDRFVTSRAVYPLHQISKGQDFFTFYHEWRANRVNCHIDLFKKHLESLYSDFLKAHDVTIDYDAYAVTETDKNAVTKLAGDIFAFKSSDLRDTTLDRAIHDAEVIHWIASKRGAACRNILDTQFFLLSADQVLRRWEQSKNTNKTPIVLLPSQWLSILLRFVDRTEDDFKSFISFLNLPKHDLSINNQQLHEVICGIAEATSDLEQQRSLTDTFIRERFDKIRNNYSAEELFQESKSFAAAHLNEKLAKTESLLAERESTISSLEIKTKEQQDALANSSKLTAGLEKILSDTQDFRRKQSVNQCIQKKMTYSKVVGWAAGLSALACTYSLVMAFIFQSWKWNHMEAVFSWISSLPANRASLINDVIKFVLLGSQIYLYKNFYTRVVDVESRAAAEIKFRSQCESQHAESYYR